MSAALDFSWPEHAPLSFARAARRMLKVTRAWYAEQRRAERKAERTFLASAKRVIAITREQYRAEREEENATLKRFNRVHNPPSTFGVYRSSRKLTPDQEKTIARAVRVVGGDEDLRQNIAVRLLTYKKPIPNLEAWCVNAAKCLFRDELRKRKTRNEGPYVEEWEHDEDTSPNCPILRGGEDAFIALIDAKKGRVELVEDPDRDLFWDLLRGFACQWLGCCWRTETGELTTQDLTELRIDGERLTPTEATWLRLLSIPACPDDLELYSDTTPKNVFDRYYEAVKKAFQRAALKEIDIHVPQNGPSQTFTL